jgi:hypothetical protein
VSESTVTIRRVVRGANPMRAKNRCRSASFGPCLLGVSGRGRQQRRAGTPASVLAVDDEGVHGDLRVAEHEGQRVHAQDGETDGHLHGVASAGDGTGQDGEDDAVARVVQQPAESGGRRVQARVPGQDVLGVRVGAVLTNEGQHGGQVVDACRTRDHTRPRTCS